tara:strand:- start:160 stop:684 length:525 start_codon:yes stop_codon:yes gene_type:complete
MSAQFLNSTVPQEAQTIRVNDATVRGSLVCNEVISASGGIDSAKIVSAAQFSQDGGTTHTQTTSLSTTVDASGAGLSRLFQVATVSATLAAGASSEFLFIMPTGTLGTSPSYHNVVCSMYDYSGSYSSNGTPFAYIGSIDPTQHRVRVIVKNLAASQALNGVIKLNLNIVGGGA